MKAEHPDCILFFRMGDFYEMFFEDAELAAPILDIALTARDREKKIPMAGVPYHAVDSYLNKLVSSGKKVAICEQVSDPKLPGIVERQIVRLVTPGTILDETALTGKVNNYLLGFTFQTKMMGVSFCDLTTGDFSAGEWEIDSRSQGIEDILARLSPKEIILPPALYNNPEILGVIAAHSEISVFPFHEWISSNTKANESLIKHFEVGSLVGFGIEKQSIAVICAANILKYLQITQKAGLTHLTDIKNFKPSNSVQMDKSTIMNLEIFSTLRDQDFRGSFLWSIDRTQTSMGGRLLRNLVTRPFKNILEIEERYEAVDYLVHNHQLLKDIRGILKNITDLERLLSRISTGVGNARDVNALKIGLFNLLTLKELLHSIKEPKYLVKQKDLIQKDCENICGLIERILVTEPPPDLNSGGLINQGVSDELDKLREILGGGRGYISLLEKEERSKTGIANLKISYNRVFGYYIEISKTNLAKVPDTYKRLQTLANAERYFTTQLKEYEEIVLNAHEESALIERKLYEDLRSEVLNHISTIQKAAIACGTIDLISSFAQLALDNNYTRPKIIPESNLQIVEGRHPVVERVLSESFVPNDTEFTSLTRLHLITGPNMAGKSVYMRQVALLTLMAQMGSFVPADVAVIGLIDSIFVRSGATDAITSNRSTFMVEMEETAYILRHATSKSLVILDEIGRGTSTFDGMSLAWSIACYLTDKGDHTPRTLFATHYHELQNLADISPYIENYQVLVEENDDQLSFLHRVVLGGSSHSYGIAVAKLAGLPKEIILEAKKKLRELEKGRSEVIVQASLPLDHPSIEDHRFINNLKDKISKLDLEELSPRAAHDTLRTLREEMLN